MNTHDCWGPGCQLQVPGQDDLIPKFCCGACRVAWRAQHTIGTVPAEVEPKRPPSVPATFSTGPLRLVDVEAIERELEQAHAVTRPSRFRMVLNLIPRRSA